MENAQRFRSRKGHRCFYCNTNFSQVDAWQRHNRKHTGVEIECDDCGELFSDNIELRSHQQTCAAFNVYSEEVYTEADTQKYNGEHREKEHETPDSTSKQEAAPSITDKNTTKDEANEIADNGDDNKGTSEYDDLIGEVNMACPDDEDLETEAMIGVDPSEVSLDDNNNANVAQETYIKKEVKSDTPQVAVSNSNNEASGSEYKSQLDENNEVTIKEIPVTDGRSFANDNTSVGSNIETLHSVTIDQTDMTKKYQPYFCKNCGARFTRKDSVTRHLRKGTCNGKSAIVCNICGKVLPDVVELQKHFKLEHKNIVFTPPVVQRNILPRHEQVENSRYPTYQYVSVKDQRLVPVSRNFATSDQQYRPMPPGIQAMFYGNQTQLHQQRHSNYGHHSSNQLHEQFLSSKSHKMKYSPVPMSKKESLYVNNPGKILLCPSEAVSPSRKREYTDYHERNTGEYAYQKSRKLEGSHYRSDKYNKNINLSEYTNNAMSAKQYYDNRYTHKESVHQLPHGISKDESRIHRCKVCGLEFPRFEYLLTHLRKHKEKLEIDRIDIDEHQKIVESEKSTTIEDELSSAHNSQYYSKHRSSNRYVGQVLNDSNSSSSAEDITDLKVAVVTSQPPIGHNDINNISPRVRHSDDHIPIVMPSSQPREHKVHASDKYTSHQEQLNLLTQQQLKALPIEMSENMVAGIDGKFRPFVCENCGQRFTRKDSLVRHAKKQTCYEEIVDLKCKHCEKTFRYQKCLIQHQELVHGISPPLDTKATSNNIRSEDEESISDKSDQVPQAAPEKQEINGTNDNSDQMAVIKSDYSSEYSSQKIELTEVKPRKIEFEEEFNPRKAEYADHTKLPKYDHDNDHRKFGHRYRHIAPKHNNHHHQPSMMYDPHQSHEHSQPKFIPPTDYKSDRLKVQDHNSSGSQPDSPFIGYTVLQPRPFQCDYCGDRFAHRHSLKRHVRRHLGIGIPCHDCGKLYRDQSEWRRHQLSIHNRHYEKCEVPSRMSFRDGVDHDLIGVVAGPSEAYRHHQAEESDSDRSDEEERVDSNMGGVERHSPSVCTTPPAVSTVKLELLETANDVQETRDETMTQKDEVPSSDESKDAGLKMFEFKSQSNSNDKDSRKSVLDLYLCSPRSDEGREVESEGKTSSKRT